MKNILFIKILIFCISLPIYGQNPTVFYKSFDSETATGIKGKSKCFDGYFTNDETSVKELSNPKNFTVEAWIAVQEYASNIAAIADREIDFKSGYLLGINPRGQLTGAIAVNGQWKSVLSPEPLPLLKWAHIAMSVESDKKLEIFINGQKVGHLDLQGTVNLCDSCGLSIGKTQTPTNASNTERITSATVKTQNRFDGLIDEFYIHPEALSGSQILQNFTKIKIEMPQPLQFRQMPSGGSTSAGFGGIYTHLKYSSGWDALWRGSESPDIVVKFENTPIRYIFWRGTGYIPAIVNEKNMWMTDQSLEHWGTGECYEAMGDKQARYTHVRMLENTPARVVVHWRYALSGIRHQLFPEDENGWSDWADEYWTIYPDGIAARKQVLWSKRYETDKGSMQWQETIFFCQPGTRPQDNVDMTALTFMDMSGNKASYSWENGPPKLPMFNKPQYQPIELIHFKAQYKPFSIFDEKRVCQPFSFGNMKDYTTFPNWNHWPVQQVMSDGRNATAPDKPSHSSLTGSNGKMQIVEKKSEGVYWAASLKGMTTQPIDSLMTLAKSWHHAPTFQDLTAGVTAIYDKYQRSYVLTCASAALKKITFTVGATAESPVYNLPIFLENYNHAVTQIAVNGKNLKQGKDFYVGSVVGLDQNKTVLFIKMKSTTPLKIQIN